MTACITPLVSTQSHERHRIALTCVEWRNYIAGSAKLTTSHHGFSDCQGSCGIGYMSKIPLPCRMTLMSLGRARASLNLIKRFAYDHPSRFQLTLTTSPVSSYPKTKSSTSRPERSPPSREVGAKGRIMPNSQHVPQRPFSTHMSIT